MKNLVLILLGIFLLGCKEDLVKKDQNAFVSEISNNKNDKWQLTYNSANQVTSILRAYGQPSSKIRYSFTYNSEGLIESVESAYVNYQEDNQSYYFVYNNEGKLISSGQTKEKINSLTIDYKKEYTLYDFEDGQDLLYYVDNGNIKNYACFNCPPIIDEYSFSELELKVPKELIQIWPLFYGQPIFLGSDKMLSKNLPTKYAVAQMVWGGAMVNEFELNHEGNPYKIRSYHGKAAYGESKPQDVTEWTIMYEMR